LDGGTASLVAKTAREVARLHDCDTATHLDRMSSYARLIATEGAVVWGLTDEFIEYVFLFAPLHDIGKVAVQHDILLKPGKLTDDEMTEMKLRLLGYLLTTQPPGRSAIMPESCRRIASFCRAASAGLSI
jgi:response regulator RpfG family c-di-GMP phosphodiesterase